MAERRYNEASFGNPGRLTYLPYGVQSAEDCGWKTVRNHNREVPKLKEVSSYHEWVVPSCKPVQGLSDGTWHENRKQRKWLLKNYPEATLGNDKLEELLADEDFGRQSRPTSSSRPVQFDLGEMADTSDPRNVVGVPLLAMAAGSAGDVLRLISPKTFVRQLGHANPWMSELLDHNEYQQTLWTEDIGTIRRVKCVVHAKRFEPVRWLIVVRDSVTTVFQPEYQVISVAATAYSRSRSLPASHIFPNMLFRITKSNTGSDFHSDVAFNPGIKAKPPQLAIIDEGGNWTVWDITGTRNRAYKRPKLRLHHCGSIKDGFRKVISRRSTMWPQWHRILWIGRSDGGDEYDYDSGDDKSSSTPKPSTASYARSSLLALCNRHTIRILDLEKKVFLPDLQLITGGAADAILDIHLDDQDPRYFYVLTTTKLFVIAELPVHTSTKNQAKRRVSILQSIPHHRSKLDPTLRISVASRSSSSSWRTSTVVLHASNGGWLDVFHTTFSKKLPEQIQIHHDSLISKKTFSTDEGYSLQAVRLRQSPMTYPLNANLKSPASSRFHHTIQVYQIFTFGSDLSLNCCLAMYSASSSDIPLSPIPDGDVLGSAKAGNAPATLLPKTPRKTAKKDQERHKELRYLGSRFVITDAMMMFQDERQPVTAGKAIAKINYASRSSGRMVQPVYEHLRRIFQELREENDASSIALDIYEAAPFDPVFVLLQAALEVGSLPLKTM
ncbi:RNA polymerase I-specific transcription-initiation factor-domain-containing protein [Xylariales sp. PMI_506]|nr:RNA polymerase I-specific transcription-initiation factor-domain-containing protein [Xylariales sp. PMI_506]